jgi:hypothetical protein
MFKNDKTFEFIPYKETIPPLKQRNFSNFRQFFKGVTF